MNPDILEKCKAFKEEIENHYSASPAPSSYDTLTARDIVGEIASFLMEKAEPGSSLVNYPDSSKKRRLNVENMENCAGFYWRTDSVSSLLRENYNKTSVKSDKRGRKKDFKRKQCKPNPNKKCIYQGPKVDNDISFLICRNCYKTFLKDVDQGGLSLQ